MQESIDGACGLPDQVIVIELRGSSHTIVSEPSAENPCYSQGCSAFCNKSGSESGKVPDLDIMIFHARRTTIRRINEQSYELRLCPHTLLLNSSLPLVIPLSHALGVSAGDALGRSL